MANFTPTKIDISSTGIHSGVEYVDGQIVGAEAVNAPIEASAWAQTYAEGFAQTPDTTDVATVGTPSVTIVNGNIVSGVQTKKFKFSNLKGETGATGASGTSAGFGTPTATATGLSAGSNPTVSISASGADTSKIFAFTFGIPKGDKGDKGDTGIGNGLICGYKLNLMSDPDIMGTLYHLNTFNFNQTPAIDDEFLILYENEITNKQFLCVAKVNSINNYDVYVKLKVAYELIQPTIPTAGTGISISNNVINVDTNTIQQKLTAGTNIDISNNVISSTTKMPSGGTQGQFLVKSSSTDYDCAWATVPNINNSSF